MSFGEDDQDTLLRMFYHQGKKHQSNLARRAAKEAADAPVQPAPQKQVRNIS